MGGLLNRARGKLERGYLQALSLKYLPIFTGGVG